MPFVRIFVAVMMTKTTMAQAIVVDTSAVGDHRPTSEARLEHRDSAKMDATNGV